MQDAAGDDLKREQIREFFDALTESDRHRLMTGFATGMFGSRNDLATEEELRAMTQMGQAVPTRWPPKQTFRKRLP